MEIRIVKNIVVNTIKKKIKNIRSARGLTNTTISV